MPIPLEKLQDKAVYCVLRDAQHRESILARGATIRKDWERHADFQKLTADEPIWNHYVRIQCTPETFIALWKDPTLPELIDEDGGEPEVLTQVVQQVVQPLIRPEAVEEINKVAEALEMDSFALVNNTPDTADPLEQALVQAAQELVRTWKAYCPTDAAPYKVKIWCFQCNRCGHTWKPRTMANPPATCPKCKSPYWNSPRKVNLLKTDEKDQTAPPQ